VICTEQTGEEIAEVVLQLLSPSWASKSSKASCRLAKLSLFRQRPQQGLFQRRGLASRDHLSTPRSSNSSVLSPQPFTSTILDELGFSSFVPESNEMCLESHALLLLQTFRLGRHVSPQPFTSTLRGESLLGVLPDSHDWWLILQRHKLCQGF
jgi:hypothetical protein